METIHAEFLSRGTLSVSDNYLAYTDRYVLRALRHIGEWRFGPDSPLPLISLKVTILGCVPWHMSSRHGASAGYVKTHCYSRSDGLIQAQGSAGVPKAVYD
jgi:hypothetical protein